jgi:ABC-type glycerol-3-phosphate transport system permease component
MADPREGTLPSNRVVAVTRFGIAWCAVMAAVAIRSYFIRHSPPLSDFAKDLQISLLMDVMNTVIPVALAVAASVGLLRNRKWGVNLALALTLINPAQVLALLCASPFIGVSPAAVLASYGVVDAVWLLIMVVVAVVLSIPRLRQGFV